MGIVQDPQTQLCADSWALFLCISVSASGTDGSRLIELFINQISEHMLDIEHPVLSELPCSCQISRLLPTAFHILRRRERGSIRTVGTRGRSGTC